MFRSCAFGGFFFSFTASSPTPPPLSGPPGTCEPYGAADKLMWTFVPAQNSPLLIQPHAKMFAGLDMDCTLAGWTHTLESFGMDAEQHARSVSNSVGIKVGFGAFSLAASRSFDSVSKSSTVSLFAEKTLLFNKITAAHAHNGSSLFKMLPEDVQNAVTPEEFIKLAGELYALNLNLGGTLKTQLLRDMSRSENSQTVQNEVESSFGKESFQVGSGSQTTDNAFKLQSHYSSSTVGGDPAKILGQLVALDAADAQIVEWSNTITNDNVYPMSGSLRPIWELLDDYPDRQQALQDYLTQKWKQEQEEADASKRDQYALAECHQGAHLYQFCHQFGSNRRRRRTPSSGWAIPATAENCPDGCRYNGQAALKDTCRASGSLHDVSVCTQIPAGELGSNTTLV